MNLLLKSVLVLMLILGASPAAECFNNKIMENEKLKAEIIAMEKAALEKWNAGNPDGFLEIYSSDITYFDPFLEKRLDGFEGIKALYEKLRGTSQVSNYEMIDPVVVVTDKMAVLSYNLNSYVGDKVYKWNSTEVFRQENGNLWKIVHSHWSLVKPIPLSEAE